MRDLLERVSPKAPAGWFARRVLELVSKIPEGKVSTYREIAAALGNPRASRAVGNILARNPRLIAIPCHRVVRSNGEVGGYSMGTRRKTKLLQEEGVKIEEGKIDLKRFMFKLAASPPSPRPRTRRPG